jgi:flagellar L-ring protein precursor FlgH
MKFSNFLFLTSLFLFTSCGTYVDNIYRDLDKSERDAEVDIQDDQFDRFRNTKRRTSSVYNKPKGNRDVSTTNQKYVEPTVKRQYQEEKVALKRTTASDLTDQGNDGSLWTGNDSGQFLFTTSKSKNSGDIVQINVLAKLKNEITLELKRAFPENPFEAKTGTEEKSKDGTAAAPKAAAKDSADMTDQGPSDRISGVVVEEINREHLLIKGRKNVLFRNRKRLVEVQALVSRKDITDDDTINSDAILESNVSVVR